MGPENKRTKDHENGKRVSSLLAVEGKTSSQGSSSVKAVRNVSAVSAPVTYSPAQPGFASNSLNQPPPAQASGFFALSLFVAATALQDATYGSTATAACSACPESLVPDTRYHAATAPQCRTAQPVPPPVAATDAFRSRPPPPAHDNSHIRDPPSPPP
jgi:hypothetical protein